MGVQGIRLMTFEPCSMKNDRSTTIEERGSMKRNEGTTLTEDKIVLLRLTKKNGEDERHGPIERLFIQQEDRQITGCSYFENSSQK